MAGPGQKRGYAKPRHTKATILKLISYMKKYNGLWTLVFVAVLVSAGAGVSGSYIIKPALNDYIIPLIGKENPSLASFAILLLVVLAIYILGALATWLNARIMLYISTDVLYRIRTDLFKKLETLPIKYFDSHPHGEIMSRFTNDIDTLRDMLSQSVPQFMSATITILSVFVMMLILSIELTVLVIFSIIAILFIATRIGKKSADAFREQQKNIGKVNAYIEELISGQRVVKVFNHENEAISDFAVLNENLRKAGTTANTFANILMPMMGNLSHIQYALIAIAGAFSVISGRMDIGTIAAFLQYTRNFSHPATMMSQQFNGILNALAGAERIFSVISEESEVDLGETRLVYAYEARDKNAENNLRLVQSYAFTGEWAWRLPMSASLKKVQGEVIFDHVTFAYKEDKTVLHDICIHAKPGKKIALVGSTGSGKTTIINLLTRFYDVSENCGTITYDGIPLNTIKKDDLRHSLGMVLQDTHLFSGSIKDNIKYGNLEASFVQIKEAAKLSNADSFIKKLENGYDTFITGDGGSLSQGQRQLLAIARAAIENPPVLVLDEATSSIDTRTEKLVQRGMDALMKGRTVFVIAHRLSTVRNADEIIVLEKGRIIERGTHEQLMQLQGKYHSLYTGNAMLD